MNVINSNNRLQEVLPNIAAMLANNAERFADRIVISEKIDGQYRGITWQQFMRSVGNIASNLRRYGFKEKDKVLIYSKNRIEMLMLELALMASGGIAVPVFFNYNRETVESLYHHSGASFIAAGSRAQLDRISPRLKSKHMFLFDEHPGEELSKVTPFSELLKDVEDSRSAFRLHASPDEICLNMFTSGTMGRQKCVQLTHRNILSQQAALKSCFRVDENDRFLSYLRWHHSFGGIFEIFNALYNGASLWLESSNGLNPNEIMENWRLVKPTVFFSVPLIYHALIDLISEENGWADVFFHPELKFVFTAAAPLPHYIYQEFEKRNIPVAEGWGLTETSPCCTVTDPAKQREPGVVGFPIAGVSIRVADDGELQVKGPNVMPGYYKDPQANERAFTEDNWFRTGDIGEYTENGFRLITRKDRIFKLSNAEKIIPTELESLIAGRCHFVSQVLVEGSGRNHPVALLFPDRLAFSELARGKKMKIENCACPENLEQFSNCLGACLRDINSRLERKFSHVKVAMLVDDELKIDNNTLTPSLKLVPDKVKEVYKAHIEKLYNFDAPLSCNFYIIEIEE